jgi:endonuclease/exonuclease/phosphatase family metal-dependent hydrolase
VLARLDTELGPLTVANTHLSFVPGWNRLQLNRLARDLRAFPGPRVLIGDLNMTPPAPQRWARLRPLATAPTFPSDRPNRQLDHILTDDPHLQAAPCSTPALPISDHRPLVVDVSRR